jgi:hypothetical protein
MTHSKINELISQLKANYADRQKGWLEFRRLCNSRPVISSGAFTHKWILLSANFQGAYLHADFKPTHKNKMNNQLVEVIAETQSRIKYRIGRNDGKCNQGLGSCPKKAFAMQYAPIWRQSS